MNEIYDIESLDELAAYLGRQDETEARKWLWDQFDLLRQYANIKEWNELVRVCEALRIIGWGDREPLEARAERWISGSYYTSLMNSYFEIQDERRWSSLKDSYVPENSSDRSYYAVRKLLSQRNPLPKSPIRWQKSGNYQRSVGPLYESLDTLKDLVIHELRPEAYGENLSYIGISMEFSSHDDQYVTVRKEYFHSENDVPAGFDGRYCIRPRFKWGRLVNRDDRYHIKVDRYFTRHFGELPLPEQKRIVAEDLSYCIEYVKTRLQKKKIAYDCDLLQSDMKRISEKWRQTRH